MDTSMVECTPVEGFVVAANKHKRVDLGGGQTGIVLYNRFVQQSGDGTDIHQIGLALREMRMPAEGIASQDCIDIFRRYFPDVFESTPATCA